LNRSRQQRRARGGFTLIELAVVLSIVGLLLGSLMYTLSAQVEQRSFEDTRRRLELARELVLSYAAVNGRLPCPARSAATTTPATVAGDEVRDSATGACTGDGYTDNYGGVNGSVTMGLLPARTIGFQQVDSSGFAVDAWQNRIRYSVAVLFTPSTTYAPHFTNAQNLKTNGVGTQPNDLLICKSATGITSTTCGSAANQVMSQSLVVAVIYSSGKNLTTAATAALATAAGRTDESANLNGDRVFVSHTPAPSGATNGEFDDQFTWITHGELYGRMISSGVLP
jgi:prepilin-type N-terminal cleavage/methylation domain-containing protein